MKKIKKEEWALHKLRETTQKLKKCIPLIEQVMQEKKTWLTLQYSQLHKDKHESYSSIEQLHHEKASKPYFGLERRMRIASESDKIITEMKGVDKWSDKTFNKTKDIMSHAARPFYKKLYNKKTTGSPSEIEAQNKCWKSID